MNCNDLFEIKLKQNQEVYKVFMAFYVGRRTISDVKAFFANFNSTRIAGVESVK